MMDKLPEECFTDHSKTFLDYSCGNGNFLVEIVKRKIQYGSTKIQALETTYGVDLMPDNVEEAKERLLEIVGDTKEHKKMVNYNIVCFDGLKWDYDNWCTPEETAVESTKDLISW